MVDKLKLAVKASHASLAMNRALSYYLSAQDLEGLGTAQIAERNKRRAELEIFKNLKLLNLNIIRATKKEETEINIYALMSTKNISNRYVILLKSD
ncbi:MAG: hypothetical protein ACYCS1_05370 [Gammaproteobacteria bacterium]